jgi:mannobiose 2-epimerase
MSGSGQNQIPDLKEHLLTQVLPFWERHSIDSDHGGFITHLARDGSITDSSEKFLVMQTRMIYSFAAGKALGGPQNWLSLADQGVAFLLHHFRDFQYDGWLWSVTREGRPRESAKRTYGHAFATYALSEYGRITRNSRALAAAIHTWSLIANYLWDTKHEGAIEACDRTWNPTNPAHTMGTHLHLLEALLALHEATGEGRFWTRVRGVCDLIVTHMVDRNHRCGLENFHPDWTHNSDLSRNLVNYGHNLEAAWLLLRVHRIEDIPAYRDTARHFLDYSLRFGLDTRHGGVFSHGPLDQPATVREKIWWVQTEALVAFLLAYLIFEDSRYWDAFRNVADFCLRHLHDPDHGEWYASTEEDGTPTRTDKGSGWKAAYHITQACAYAHQYLSDTRAGA